MMKKGSLNIDDFQPLHMIRDDGFIKILKIKNKKTNELCIAKISNHEENPDFENENAFIHKEINILSKLSHPNFPKLIGYSKVDFEHKPKPVIFLMKNIIQKSLIYQLL